MDKKSRKYWSARLFRRGIQFLGSRFYLDTQRDTRRSILVAGTARSGTTWLGELISAQIPCRMMFEPFNRDLVNDYRTFQYFQYMRQGQRDETLYAFARRVFSGEIRNYWIDRKNESLLPKIRLIKEIRANLLLKWIYEQFPEVPLILIIRHPCAVVLSRMELGWATDTDIASFLLQPSLISDHLSEYIDLIEGAQSDEEKHAIIWCISYLVPLRQFQAGTIRIVFYENLCNQPEEELSHIFSYTRLGDTHIKAIKADKPSTTSSLRSAVISGESKISRWRIALSTAQIAKIQKIVSRFGLDYLYGDSLTPLI